MCTCIYKFEYTFYSTTQLSTARQLNSASQFVSSRAYTRAHATMAIAVPLKQVRHRNDVARCMN